MDKPIFDKAYDPKAWEDKLSLRWKESGFFNPDVCVEKGVTEKKAETFSIVLPPPNVTGTLHVGHASMLAIEDAVVRFKRMRGYKTLWIPGTDHAAIATQSKVEKLLNETEGKSRYDLGRDEFLKRVEKFAHESHNTIVHQVEKLGSSVDWSREAYTLDEKRSLAVRTAFERMYQDGIIYRGNRIVNWDPLGQTTISDDEVVYKEESAKLYYLKYGPFEIATARPETKFGDKYVVMHPDDERYLKYKDGDKLTVEWMNGPIEATIIKDPVIDKEFGTGVMTITPSHSHVDFDLAQKHKLDIEQIIDTNGRLLAIAGEFSGMKIEEAREKIVERLKEKGLFVREEPYHHQIATAERTGAVIEPQVMRQWFVDVNKEFNRDGKKVSLKSLMQGAVREGDIKILPERFEKTYFHWIDNLRDWCISRQIWFGHRIPVWYCLSCENPVVNAKVKAKWFLVRHGETDWNKERRTQGHQDSPLNETGREQAHRVALQLKNHDIGLIISSDLGRCKETAEVIAKATGAPVDFDEALRERYYGEAEGLLYEETENQFGHPYASYEEAQGNAESPKELEERIASAFSRHKETHGHKNVVIVSHGASLRMLMKRIRNLSFDDARRRPGIKNAESFSLDILETPCEKCGNDLFEQDPDTLDTWFSSGLWTFSTLGWPDEKEWAKNRLYHPTALLETGYDILFFWVARMILMSEYLLGEAPFKTVYLHGLVRDEKGRKMTKSLGNVLNPLDVIDRYGADALRLALLVGATPGNDIKLDDEKVTALRNLVNKIWNMGRYVTSAVDTKELQWKTEKVTPLSLADDWILFRLGKVTTAVSAHLENFNLSLATDELRDFTWSDVADWYIEIHKIEKNDAVLVHVFNQLLTLWHPFMPFVTEAVFASLYPKEKFPLMVQAWPQITASETNAPQAEQFEGLKELITRIRNIRSLYHIDPKELLTLTLIKNDGVSEESFPLIERLGRVKNILLTEKSAQPKESARVLGGAGFSGFVHLSGVIDVENERGRLTKEKEGLQKFITNLESRLSDSKFTERAPKEIIDQQRVSLEEARAKEKFFQESITHLN